MRVLSLGLLGILTTSVLAMAACGASETSSAPFGGAGGATANEGDPNREWSFPSSTPSQTNDTGSGGAGGGAGGAGLGSGGSDHPGPTVKDCGYGPATTAHLTLPGSGWLTAAPIARARLARGEVPPPTQIAAGDFLNYYHVTYDPPPQAQSSDVQAIAGVTLGDAVGLSPGTLLLQVGVQGGTKWQRQPLALAVVVDTSISMEGKSLDRARAAAAALAHGLVPGDAFTVITTKRAVLTDVAIQAAADVDAAAAKAGGVMIDAGEDLAGAVADAYDHVNSLVSGAVGQVAGRVVLITDGAAQPTAIDLGTVAENLRVRDISLMGVGVGDVAGYDRGFLDVATSVGGGTSVFLADESEAEPMIHQRFDELLGEVASDVRVDVSLPEGYRLQTLTMVGAGVGTDEGGIVSARLGPKRSLLFRAKIETCNDLKVSDPYFGISVLYTPRGTAPGQTYQMLDASGALSQLRTQGQAQVAKASAIAAFGEGIANVRPTQLQLAATMAGSALLLQPLGMDDELSDIQGLIQAELCLLGVKGATCP